MSAHESSSVEGGPTLIEKLDAVIQKCSREELEQWTRALILARSLCTGETSVDWEATFTTKCRLCGHTATREAKSNAFFGFEPLFKLFGVNITPAETCPSECVAHALIGIPKCPGCALDPSEGASE